MQAVKVPRRHFFEQTTLQALRVGARDFDRRVVARPHHPRSIGNDDFEVAVAAPVNFLAAPLAVVFDENQLSRSN